MSVHSHTAAQHPADTPEFPRHVVTAVLVAHDGARWLPDALAGLTGQERPVQSVIAADTGSSDASAQLLADALGSDRVVHLARRTGFGAAVAEAVRVAGPVPVESLPHLYRQGGWNPAARAWDDDPDRPGPGEPVQWLWLLHDDCEPAPDALAELLRVADSSPSAAIVGPKLRSWYDRRSLLEVGVSIARSGRRWTGLERREQDQGQHDQVRQVLAVSSAGMLVRRDVWEELGGFDPALPLMRDDVDFCWRAQSAGHRVLVAPDAVLRHAEAASRERRPVDCAADRPHQVDKAGAVHTLLANTRGPLLAYVALRIVLGTLLRTVGYLVGKAPGQALDEITGLLGVLLRPGRLIAARRRRGRPQADPAELRPLFPPPGATVRLTVEQFAGNVSGRVEPESPRGRHGAVESGPSDEDGDFIEVEQFARLKRIARKPAPVLFAVLLLVSLVACRGLYGTGVLSGGALLPAPDAASELWSRIAEGRHTVGVGGTASTPPYLALVALLGTLMLGNAGLAVAVLLVGSVPLAGLSAYFASRPLVESRLIRAWAAVAYAFLPAVTGALAGGRLGTAVLAVLLPLTARAAVAATGLALDRDRIADGARPGWRATWAFALLTTVTTAFTPVVWPLTLVLCAAAIAFRAARGHRQLLVPLLLRGAAVLGTPVLLLAPWSLALFTHPGRFLLEAGLPYGGDPASAADLLLLNPGGPGTVSGWLMAGVLLAGLGALLRTERRTAVLGAWAVALASLAAAVLLNGASVTPADGTAPGTAWAGPAVLVYGLALLTAAAVGAEGARERVTAMDFGWRQPAAALTAAAAVLAPLAASLTWMVAGAEDPLRRGRTDQVPAFVAEESTNQDRARTLVVDGSAGTVSYALVRGAGAGLGDAEAAVGEGGDARLGTLVGNLVAGSGADQASQLANYAVRYVLVRDSAPRSYKSVLDSTPGLSRLSQSNGISLWRVDRPVARVTVTDEGGKVTTVASGPVEVHTDVPAGDGKRILRLAEAAAPGWTATLDGKELGPVTLDDWAQGFALPAQGGRLDITYDTPLAHTAWVWIQGFLLLVAVVLALPGRRREVDDDLPEAEDTAAEDLGEGRRARRLRAAAEAEAAARPSGAPQDPAADDAAGDAAGDGHGPYAAVPRQAGPPPGTAGPADAEDRQEQYGNEQYGNEQYGQEQYGWAGDRQPEPAEGQASYAQDPYAQDPYAQDPYTQAQYAQEQYAQDPYAQGFPAGDPGAGHPGPEQHPGSYDYAYDPAGREPQTARPPQQYAAEGGTTYGGEQDRRDGSEK
ncbi:glycosyltransferase [Streptomyces sp. HB2AG]|uniref:glycosyltransferase n=1 Tax=Streptomyces sp. HB2AG TaxID=2983400 RepID=UPI0022AAA9F6|nr:glycosyltransferase [Streptomyces sp. HB2AG]MCZ2526869.1 glycosyltransferase [Streptomyces sp. HB2AG]